MTIRSNDMSKSARRAQLMTGAATAVLVAMSAIPAGAADVVVQLNPDSASAIGGLALQPVLLNTVPISASVLSVANGIGGTQTGSDSTVTANTAAARATGNFASTTIDQTNILLQPAGGIAAVSLSTNTGAITSLADGNAFTVKAQVNAGSILNSANLIGADATGNRTLTRIDTLVPTAPGGLGFGSATFNIPDTGILNAVAASGDIVASTVQQNSGVNDATVSDNRIGLDIDTPALAAVGAALDDNTIAATYKGNSANTVAAVNANGLPTFGGSIVVTNMQANDAAIGLGQLLTQGSASNFGSRIDGFIGFAIVPLPPLNGSFAGSLTVSGNTISAAAIGNEAAGATTAGNSILIADGVSVLGSGGLLLPGSTYTLTGTSAVMGATADLALLSSQRNTNASDLLATTSGGLVIGAATSLIGGTITLDENTFDTAATGNLASNAILTGTGAATFDATAAILNHQVNVGGSVIAQSTDNAMVAGAGSPGLFVFDSAHVAIIGSTDRASAYGNNSTQRIAIAATTISLGDDAITFAGSAIADGTVTGGATVSNIQLNTAAPTSAFVNGSRISGESAAIDLIASDIEVSGNTQEAIGIGNAAASGISLTGTTVGTGAGVFSAQANDADSPTTATIVGTARILANQLTGSGLTLADNVQRAIAYGNSATSTLAVSATQTEIGLYDPLAAGGVIGIQGGFSVQNAQLQLGAVTANAGSLANVPFNIATSTSLNRSSANNDGNALIAAAYGNQTANSNTLALGTLVHADPLTGSPPIGTLLNIQISLAPVTANVIGDTVISTLIGEDLLSSDLSVTGNSIQALAYGNRASANTLAVTGVDITTFPNAAGDPAFGFGNSQNVNGTILATQRDDGIAASIGAEVDGQVQLSSIILADNVSTTLATGNAAVNLLTLAATTLSTTAVMGNFQQANAQVIATAGALSVAATPGSPAVPFAFNAVAKVPANLTGNVVGTNVTLTGGILSVVAATLTPAEVAQLLADNWTVVGANLEISAVLLGQITLTEYTSLTGGNPVSLPATIPAIPATGGQPNQGGGHVTLGADIFGSSIKVADNAASAGAVVNNAVNGLTATATQAGGADTGGVSLTLFNQQEAAAGTSATAEIGGAFSITGTDETTIVNSELYITGNSQVANALVNVASNSLTLTATGIGSDPGNAPGTLLTSSQTTLDNIVTATSDLSLAAPVSSVGSGITISGNSNTALGVLNDVTNKLTVAATTSAGNGDGLATLFSNTVVASQADHLLNTVQSASGRLSATATTTISNNDTTLANVGVLDGAVAYTGNVTTAEASANRALNSVSVIGTATQSAGVGLRNIQTSTAGVSADAATNANVVLTAGPGSLALENGSVALNGNVTTALARGNAATNAMTVTASTPIPVNVPFAPPEIGASFSNGVASVHAQAAVLNSQNNSGGVSATATGTYGVALNAGLGLPDVTGSSVKVANNVVNAAAYGNTATNTLHIAALGGSFPSAAVGSYQVNSGAITAVASNVTFVIGSPLALSGSTLHVGGNQVTATAVGNSVVTALTTGH